MQDLTPQQAQISTELDDLVAQRQHLETLEFTQRQSKSNTPPSRSKSASCAVSPRRSSMDDTQDLHHQAQLDEQEQAVTRVDLDLIAYKALGCAQAIRDYPYAFDSAIKRLIELANQYDNLRSKL
jgi:hypothetical protein